MPVINIVCYEGERVTNQWKKISGNRLPIDVWINIWIFNNVCSFIVNMFDCCRIVLLHSNTLINYLWWRAASSATRDDEYCEVTIPVVKGHHVTWQWQNRGVWLSIQAPYSLLRAEFKWPCTGIKVFVIIVIKTDSGECCQHAPGMWKQHIQL